MMATPSALLALLLRSLSAQAADPLAMPADLYRGVPGSTDALVTAPLHAPEGFLATADLVVGRRLLTYQLGTLPEELLVRSAVAVQVAASWGQERWDVGVSLPTYAHLDGTLYPDGGVGTLGDLGVQGRVGVVPWLSATAGATLPTGTPARMTGYGKPTGQVGLIAGSPRLRAAIGYTIAPSVDIGTVSTDDRLLLSARYGHDLSADWTLSAEVWTAFSYQSATLASLPGELLISGHHRLSGGGLLRMGVGTAILPGVGVPALRFVLGVGQSSAAPDVVSSPEDY